MVLLFFFHEEMDRSTEKRNKEMEDWFGCVSPSSSCKEKKKTKQKKKNKCNPLASFRPLPKTFRSIYNILAHIAAP